MARRVKKKGSKVKEKKLPVEVSRSEYLGLLKNSKYLRHKIAFMIAWESGLRISEVVNLKKDDIHIGSCHKESYIRVNLGKNSKDRIVCLPQSWQKHHINYIPMKCKQRALQKALIAAAEKSGLKAKKPTVHFHSLRHGFATHCIRCKVDINKVQMAMGHEDVQTTSIYINLAPTEMLEEIGGKFN